MAKASKPEIQIDGLKELSKALKDLDRVVARELSREFKGLAGTVADDARGRVPVRSGDAAGSIKAGASSQSAFIRAYKGVAYGKWLDFGSRNPRSGQPRSVGPWKGSGKGPDRGRFVYPAVEAHRDDLERAALEAVQQAARKVDLREGSV